VKHNPGLITVITGTQGEGKSTLLKRIIDYLILKGLKPGGILTDGIWKDGRRDFLIARNISTQKEIPFCQREAKLGWLSAGSFYLNPAANSFALEAVKTKHCEVFIIDEIGKFELEEKGWYDAFTYLLRKKNIPLIFVIRDSFLNIILSRFSFTPEKLIIVDYDKEKPVEEILSPSISALIKR
jgi:nucleoside-triphosphatase THEP1